MTVYVPILKGLLPGFQALRNADRMDKRCIRPLIEAVPQDENEKPEMIADRLARQVKDAELNALDDIAIDTGRIADQFGRRAAQRILRKLGDQLGEVCRFRPVLHVTDNPDDELDGVRHVAATHHMGVCLRVDPPYARTLSDSRMLLEQLESVGQPVERADVVIDCGFIESVPHLLDGISGPLRHLAKLDWRSVTIAAGSFPPPAFIDGLPTATVTSVPRLEVPLWTQVRQRWPRANYGDYTIENPGPPSHRLRGTPALHYTAARSWVLYRRPKGTRGRDSVFRDICQCVVRSSYWRSYGPGFSWGDHCIATLACHDASPGQARQWRAYAISHHLAVIAADLQSQARPD
ncbi:hypothetical protein ACIBI7_53305 [Nonomuraea fuscirosea]|uniref:beta family protein n=1 Tax=Nonomuraea fuscirosea TaxID=1291556 RepID=UPI0037B342A8